MLRDLPQTDAGSTAHFHGDFRVYLKPDGTMIVPDLAEPLIPLLRRAGADESLWQPTPCVVKTPVMLATRNLHVGISRERLSELSEGALWDLHAQGMTNLGQQGLTVRKDNSQLDEAVDFGPPRLAGKASLFDVKIELSRRLLAPCRLCERRCPVDRLKGETGFCGLGSGIQLGAYSMLYNEGPLVGAPTFAVFVRGCSLRCTFCYRPDELRARGRPEATAEELAEILELAARRGAESWHFLGGNPDESLPSILQALALTQSARPVVWNSALMLTPQAVDLLKGVVDIWLPDFKFGNDLCAREIAGIDGYTDILFRNLDLLRDQMNVVVRHMVMPYHRECCTEAVRAFVQQNHPAFLFHDFPVHERPVSTSDGAARPGRESWEAGPGNSASVVAARLSRHRGQPLP